MSNTMIFDQRPDAVPFNYNGIDRIDSGEGYTIDNVVPSCPVCNVGKMDRSIEEFYEWALRLADNIRAKRAGVI